MVAFSALSMIDGVTASMNRLRPCICSRFVEPISWLQLSVIGHPHLEYRVPDRDYVTVFHIHRILSRMI